MASKSPASVLASESDKAVSMSGEPRTGEPVSMLNSKSQWGCTVSDISSSDSVAMDGRLLALRSDCYRGDEFSDITTILMTWCYKTGDMVHF